MDRRLLLTVPVLLLAALAPAQCPAQAPAVPPDAPAPSGKGRAKAPSAVRERLVELLLLPKDKLWPELEKWPAFQQMTLQEQAAFLQKLAGMRQRLHAQALRKAAELGLRLDPSQEDVFFASYLRARLEMERQLAQDPLPKRRKLEEQMTADLRRQYGAGEGKAAAVPAPVTPAVPAAPTAPAATSPR